MAVSTPLPSHPQTTVCRAPHHAGRGYCLPTSLPENRSLTPTVFPVYLHIFFGYGAPIFSGQGALTIIAAMSGQITAERHSLGRNTSVLLDGVRFFPPATVPTQTLSP